MLKFYPLVLMRNMIKILSVIIAIITLFSYIEILCKNVNPNPTYSSWNIISNIGKEDD